jgi:hypothetical protein
MAWPPAKKQLTIPLDENVLDWLKAHGRGCQTRINGDGKSTAADRRIGEATVQSHSSQYTA